MSLGAHTLAEARARLLVARPPAWVIQHSACVERLATAMAERVEACGGTINLDVVAAGAALHDLGRSITQGPTHGWRGAQLLEDWPEPIVRCVACHTGGGITADEAAHMGLPRQDLVPRTIEEKIVCHADNLYTGSKRLQIDQVMQKYKAKNLGVAAARIGRLHQELEGIMDLKLNTLGVEG